MKSKGIVFFTVVRLVALPMFIGFAGPEASHGKWDRVVRHGDKLIDSLFAMRSASAKDDDAPYAAYPEALDVLKSDYYGDKIDTKKSKDLTSPPIHTMLFTLNDP